MKTLATILLLAAAMAGGGIALNQRADATPPERAEAPSVFRAVHIYIDSGDVALAAYQFELTATQGRMKIVGVENGEHPAFAEPPYYDRKAVQGGKAERVIIAAFSTHAADELPTGKTRVATIHLQATADLDLGVELQAASDPQGKKIQPTITFEKGNDR